MRELLREDHRYVFTLIHKFRTERGEAHPVLSERRDIIVITDEAHRSQYDTLALNMRTALPNASFLAFTGTPLIEAYGLTETSPAACINPMDLDGFNGCIGLPISSTECAIMSDDGELLPQGEVGELVIRGPQVMKGYWNNPDATADTLTDGWIHTGDIATMTAIVVFTVQRIFVAVDRVVVRIPIGEPVRCNQVDNVGR